MPWHSSEALKGLLSTPFTPKRAITSLVGHLNFGIYIVFCIGIRSNIKGMPFFSPLRISNDPGKVTFHPQYWTTVSDEAKELIQLMLNLDKVRERLNMALVCSTKRSMKLSRVPVGWAGFLSGFFVCLCGVCAPLLSG